MEKPAEYAPTKLERMRSFVRFAILGGGAPLCQSNHYDRQHMITNEELESWLPDETTSA